jgi:hypothetical protein
MAATARFDTSEIDRFAADLRATPKQAVDRTRRTVKRAAVDIKKQLRTEMSKSRYFDQIVPSISFDYTESPTRFEAEVGPDKRRRSARLANIAYFGGANGGGGRVPDPERALEAQVPVLERFLGRLLKESL